MLVVASMAAACGTADPDAAGPPAPDPTVNALEASGQVEFFVKVVGANGQAFSGESNNARFRDSIPAIRYFSDVTKGASNARTRCTAFRFTKVVGAASPQLVAAVASGETLQSVHFDFVRANGSVFQHSISPASGSPTCNRPSPRRRMSPGVLEEATLVPAATATVTLTANPLNPDGSAGAAIVSTFTCRS